MPAPYCSVDWQQMQACQQHAHTVLVSVCGQLLTAAEMIAARDTQYVVLGSVQRTVRV
jgi:hypothetical protein